MMDYDYNASDWAALHIDGINYEEKYHDQEEDADTGAVVLKGGEVSWTQGSTHRGRRVNISWELADYLYWKHTIQGKAQVELLMRCAQNWFDNYYPKCLYADRSLLFATALERMAAMKWSSQSYELYRQAYPDKTLY